ncbi:unnamed protein product [Bathycoccus prasinos]
MTTTTTRCFFTKKSSSFPSSKSFKKRLTRRDRRGRGGGERAFVIRSAAVEGRDEDDDSDDDEFSSNSSSRTTQDTQQQQQQQRPRKSYSSKANTNRNIALAKALTKNNQSSFAAGGRRRERDDEMDLKAALRLLKASPPPPPARRRTTRSSGGSGGALEEKKKALTSEQPKKKTLSVSDVVVGNEENDEEAKTKRRQRRRRKSSGVRNEGLAVINNSKDGKKKKEGSGDESSEKDSLDGVLLDAQSEKALGEAVKELLRLEYIAKALDDEEFTMRTRDEEMDARDEENPMATSDAILSIFDAKPKNAMEIIKNDGSGKNRSKRMKAEEDIMYERKFARAAELNVNELRKRLDAGKRARQILVSKNIGLARLCAHRTMKQINTEANTNFSYQLSDMISDGQEGLVNAASKYDPSLGFRFSTYAYAWVLSSIQRGLDSNSNTIRTPTHARVEKMKIKNLEKNLDESLGRMPTDEEVARIAGVDVKRIEAIGNFGVSYAMPRATGSGKFSGDIGDASEILVADQGDANGATAMADFCTTDAEERALKLVERDLFKDDLEHVFDTLLPRERRIRRRTSGRGNPMANILARKMGLSVNAVRSIEQRALEKLRAPQRARILEKHAMLPEANFTFSSNPLRMDDRPITGGVNATNAKKKSVEEEISDIILERVEVTLKSEDVEKIAQSSVRNTTWSSYELKLMSDMRGKGIPWKKVAVAIGRTETSCKQMYRKVGGSTRKHTPSMDEKTKAAMQKIEEGDAIINA